MRGINICVQICKRFALVSDILPVAIAALIMISACDLSFADPSFYPLGEKTIKASSGSVGGIASVTVPFSASLNNRSNNSPATTVTWTGATSGTTGWLAANQYIAVQGFATYSDWGIQIYTDNKDYTGTGFPAGLINTANALYSLPMAWRTKTERLATGSVELKIVQKTVGGYTVLDDGVTPDDSYYPWFFMLDKNGDADPAAAGNQGFGNYQPEATFIGSAGYHHAPGDVNYATPTATDTTYYIYLGANFTMAMPGQLYETESLVIMMYRL
jgi:hypothetical protein